MIQTSWLELFNNIAMQNVYTLEVIWFVMVLSFDTNLKC